MPVNIFYIVKISIIIHMTQGRNMEMTLRSAHEWLTLKNKEAGENKATSIYDPDGWRHNDGITMDTAITLEEFDTRLKECTHLIKNA